MIKILILYITLIFSCSAVANKPGDTSGYLYGLGISTNKEIYKGYNRRTILLPIIGYRGEKLNVYGPFVSYRGTELSDFNILIQAAPRFQGFDDTDSYIFEGMKDRKFSMDVGASLNYKNKDWKISFSSMLDVLNRSNGIEMITSISHTFRFGPIFVEPKLTFSYLDSNHVDYYYGVGKDEVGENRAEYIGKNALNTGFGLSISTPILFGGFTQLSLQRTWFSEEITDSPLVEDHKNIIVRLLYNRSF
jgi:outer membrane protein